MYQVPMGSPHILIQSRHPRLVGNHDLVLGSAKGGEGLFLIPAEIATCTHPCGTQHTGMH